MCAQQVPGDTYRNLVVHTSYSRQTFKHILAPVWLMTYTYGARSFQCVQNGVTGAIEGEYPKSPWKIARIVLALLHRRGHRAVGRRRPLEPRSANLAARPAFAHPAFAPYRRWLATGALPDRRAS